MDNSPSTIGAQEIEEAIEDIANQLCAAADSDFDVLIKTEIHDPAIEKLQVLCNFALDSAHHALADSRAREARLSAVLATAVDSIIVIDETGVIESANPAVKKMFGYRPEELVGQNVRMLAGPPHRHKHDSYLRRYLDTGKSRMIGAGREVVAQRKDETLFRVDLAVSEILLQEDRKFVGIVRDITAYKKAQAEIHRSHQELDGLLQAISSILIGVDGSDRVTKWNRVAESTFGIDEKDVSGKSLFDCGIAWEWGPFRKWVDECRTKTQPSRSDEIRYTAPDGKEKICAFTLTPLGKIALEQPGFLLLGTDITERKVLESELAHARKLESIGQLAAGIAHEINTPAQFASHNTHFLNTAFARIIPLIEKYKETIQAAREGSLDDEFLDGAEAILKKAKVDFLVKEIPKAVDQAADGLDRIAKIVSSMKEFSHPGSSEMTHTDINHALDNTVTVSKNEWKYVAKMETEFDPELPHVPCLPGELNQVFLNLIVNAAQAIAERNSEAEEITDTITIRTRSRDDGIEIEIADTGPGIPESVLSKIFDPFFTTKEVGKGTGQGLAIAHSVIVDKHHGAIACKSEVGQGTTFTIFLPSETDDASTASAG